DRVGERVERVVPDHLEHAGDFRVVRADVALDERVVVFERRKAGGGAGLGHGVGAAWERGRPSVLLPESFEGAGGGARFLPLRRRWGRKRPSGLSRVRARGGCWGLSDYGRLRLRQRPVPWGAWGPLLPPRAKRLDYNPPGLRFALQQGLATRGQGHAGADLVVLHRRRVRRMLLLAARLGLGLAPEHLLRIWQRCLGQCLRAGDIEVDRSRVARAAGRELHAAQRQHAYLDAAGKHGVRMDLVLAAAGPFVAA